MRQIISIHGAPRSGTSWLGQIFDSSPQVRYKFQPLFSYSFKDQVNINSTVEDWTNFFESLYNTEDSFLDQSDKKENGVYPDFKSKDSSPNKLVMKMVRYHQLVPKMLELMPDIKIIGIVRNPCSVINSWRKAPREFLKDWNFDEEWYFGNKKNKFRPEEYYGFFKWKETTNLFLTMSKKYPSNFLLIRYEDLVLNTLETTKQMFEFTNLEIEGQTINFINKSKSHHNNDVYSVYKGNKDINEWRQELPEKVIKQIYTELVDTEFEFFL